MQIEFQPMLEFKTALAYGKEIDSFANLTKRQDADVKGIWMGRPEPFRHDRVWLLFALKFKYNVRIYQHTVHRSMCLP